MTFTTLDIIVRSVLLKTGRPIHYYIQYLKHACDALRELTFDSLKNVNTVKLALNEYNAVPLPCSFADLVSVGLENFDMVRPLAQVGRYNRLNNFDTAGQKALYATPADPANCNGLYWNWTESVRDDGEFMGRMFGGVANYNGFKVLREREEIQFDIHAAFTHAILEFISDGTDNDAATKVHPYAQKTIEEYVLWQAKIGTELAFNQAHKRLRSRLNPMTTTEMKAVFSGAYSGTYR